MRPKERVLTAFAHQEPDRVPLDYSANPGIDSRLKAHYGLAPDDHEGLRRALGIDFRHVSAPYVGPKLHPDVPGVQVDMWGIHRRWIEHPSGGYWDYCDFPLRDASLVEVEAWPMPSPDDFDYGVVREQCARYQDYCVVLGGAGVGDLINSTGMIRTMQQVLIDLALGEPATLRYMDRKVGVQVELLARSLEAAEGQIDLLAMGEDLGTQIGPMIGLDMYRTQIRPYHRRIVDVAEAFGIPVMIHSCGSSSWAFEDFIEIGIGIVDTLQPEAKDMSPEVLKSRFGDRLAFHGCISTAGPVAYGSVAEVEENVRQTLAIMMPGGGYALAPTHQLQDNSPTENVVAMYDVAKRCGTY